MIDPKAEFRSHGREMFRSTYKRYLQMLAIFFVPALRFYTNPKFFDEKGSDFILTNFRHIIKERMKMGNKRDDLVDTLIEINEKQLNDSYSTYEYYFYLVKIL